ncbi:PHP domain-containing protein [Brachybacterium alimentarium]|uniref:Phosphatase n=1 Tax=Brachybacterium alimentarium TaxID=47845 RepID=A0A2A3YHK7_9MICO|nr:PHP domain-containing protein [Brachybacterium alimentarium]PCC38758.1 phosphatase [Brachybacterium alimentarium]RCS80380.1 PHP domain-containing protein [Brachybacterium alimentarium]
MSERSIFHSTERIDLHSHTSWSDGTCDVAELFEQARDAGLGVLALTDHDTVGGWAELPAAVAATGVSAVPGIEVSSEHGRLSVHVLALLVDPDPHSDLAREMARARDSRVDRARDMVELIAKDYPISWEDVRAQAAGDATVIGRPHIADALVAHGAIPDRSEAFREILSPSGPYYVPYYAPSPVDAVQAIHAAGGVALIAHPGSVTRDASLPLDLLETMVEAGLDGIEVDHREHDEAERARLRDFAARHDLLITGGSDYHGAGKPNRLGENLTQPDVLAAITHRATSSTEVIR